MVKSDKCGSATIANEKMTLEMVQEGVKSFVEDDMFTIVLFFLLQDSHICT